MPDRTKTVLVIVGHAESSQRLAADVIQQPAAGKGFAFAGNGEAA